MAEDHREFILSILEDLRQDELKKLGTILKGKKIEGCEIPFNKLENLDSNKATTLFMSYYENPLKALELCLCEIPRKDLLKKIKAKIETGKWKLTNRNKPQMRISFVTCWKELKTETTWRKFDDRMGSENNYVARRPLLRDMKNKHEAQNNEKVALIKSCPGSNDRPPYTGKYTLVDLQDYATKNQDQLIMHLENILEPDGFNALKKELICSVLNKFFSFTAQKYFELFRNGELKEFLKKNGKPKKIPMKLLDILFSKKKNNRKRKAQEQMQREGNNINLKKKQEEKIIPIHPIEHKSGNEDNNVIGKHWLDDQITLGTENEKTIRIHPIEHKSGNEDNNVIGEHWLDDKITLGIENEKIIPIHPIEHKSGNEDNNVIGEHWLDDKITLGTENEKIIPIHPIEHKSGNEDNNVIGEHWLDKDSRMAIEKWCGKKNYYRERISFNYIGICEHQEYPCFIAEDILQFRLSDNPDYRILAILQDKRDFTNSQKLKKEVEFALQFNMAVLDVQLSEVISSKGFVCEIKADKTFAECKRFLTDIVFEIVLPVLALFKWVKLNPFKNAVYPNLKKQIFP